MLIEGDFTRRFFWEGTRTEDEFHGGKDYEKNTFHKIKDLSTENLYGNYSEYNLDYIICKTKGLII